MSCMLFYVVFFDLLKVQEKRRRKQPASGQIEIWKIWKFWPQIIHVFLISECFSLSNSSWAYAITVCRMFQCAKLRELLVVLGCPTVLACFSSVLVTATVTASLPTTAIPDPWAPCKDHGISVTGDRAENQAGDHIGDVDGKWWKHMRILEVSSAAVPVLRTSKFAHGRSPSRSGHPNKDSVRTNTTASWHLGHCSWTSCWSTPSMTTTPSFRKPSSQPVQHVHVLSIAKYSTSNSRWKLYEMVPNS